MYPASSQIECLIEFTSFQLSGFMRKYIFKRKGKSLDPAVIKDVFEIKLSFGEAKKDTSRLGQQY